MQNQNQNDFRTGHRKRMRQKMLDAQLAGYEYLELILTWALPRIDTRQIARELLRTFGGVRAVMAASIEDLEKINGISDNTALFLKALHGLTTISYRENLSTGPVFHNYQNVSEYFWTTLADKNTEEMHAMYLGADYRMLAVDVHSVGTVDWAVAYPREILKRAMNLGARSVILAHNHLTPVTSFSSPDITLTHEIERILKTVDISLHDHLLVSGNIVYSARNMFIIKENKKAENKQAA